MDLAIFGVRLGQACARLTHPWVKFSRVAQHYFLTVPSVCRGPNCSPPPLPGRAQNGSDCTWVVLSQPGVRSTSKSDCTWVGLSQPTLGLLLRGQTAQFGGGRTVRPLWGWIVTICKH